MNFLAGGFLEPRQLFATIRINQRQRMPAFTEANAVEQASGQGRKTG
jgi:hypothetical protein